MIPQTLIPCHNQPSFECETWQQSLKNAFRTAKDLLNYLELSPSDVQLSTSMAEQFPVRVPLYYASLMEKGNALDPLLLQVLNRQEEQIVRAEDSKDPLGEASANPLPGLIHKYRSRVLLTLTGACAIHCRYCFRRHFPYADNRINEQQIINILEYVQRHPEINEIILSGGDPLSVSDNALGKLIQRLNKLPQLKRLRIHTRFPVVIPQRITPELIAALGTFNGQVIMVLHINHAAEISHVLAASLTGLKTSGITLLNQAVLLADINDDVDSLVALSESCFDVGVLPYYLHLLDAVEGAGHFHVNDRKALALYEQMQIALPGYLVPCLVRETSGKAYKIRL